MVTRDIKCGACGLEGKVEAHDTVNVVPESKIFKNLGKDSSTGFLHFSCPSCNEDLAVDPLKAIAARQMVGYPESSIASGKAQGSNPTCAYYMGNCMFDSCILHFRKIQWLVDLYSGWNLAHAGMGIA